MKTVNYSELRASLKEKLNEVSENRDILIVHRSGGKSVVMMSLEEYNSIQETSYLLRSKANRKRLEKAVENINNRKNNSLTL